MFSETNYTIPIYRYLIALIFIGFTIAFSLGFADAEKTKLTEVQLGEKLFFEKTLSLDSTISCASCHKPEFGFADNVPFSVIFIFGNTDL